MTAMVHLGMIATLTLIVPGSARTLNATEVEGLVVRESNASTACGPGPAAGRGCARVAVLLVAGFHDVRYCIGHRFDGRQKVDPGHPLLAAWLRTTSLSLRRHVVGPNRADVFIYSWNPSLADAFESLYSPVRAAFARNAPLMRKIKRGALAGCPLVNANLRCSENAVSWAYTIREAEVLLSGHERARGFPYDAVVFARPDIILFADVDERELVDARTVVMPSPNRGDHFFMMHRRTASVFATAFDVAATKPGCAIGCVDADSLKAIGQTSGRAGAHADMQLWKSAFLTLRAKATLRPSKNKQPEHVAPYRTFGLIIVLRFAEMTVGAGPTLRLFKMGSAGFGDFGFLAIVAVAGPRRARAGLASPPPWDLHPAPRHTACSGRVCFVGERSRPPGCRGCGHCSYALFDASCAACPPLPAAGGRLRAVRPVRLLCVRNGAGFEFLEDGCFRLGFFKLCVSHKNSHTSL